MLEYQQEVGSIHVDQLSLQRGIRILAEDQTRFFALSNILTWLKVKICVHVPRENKRIAVGMFGWMDTAIQN